MLTQQKLKDVLDYNKETGIFSWKSDAAPCARKGKKAGSLRGKYVAIRIDYKRYLAHRLAWMFVTGLWPDFEIDHIDGDGCNNKLSNLRVATRSENEQNKRRPYSNNRTGILGVIKVKNRDLYRAQIAINGNSMHLGYFKDPKKAGDAYIEAKRQIHPFSTI